MRVAGRSSLAFVGCLNRPAPYPGGAHGRGIAVLSLDLHTGALHLVSHTEGIDNPSFLAVSADGRRLYATSEVYGWHEGVVSAYAIGDAGGLTYINKQPTLGSVAAHVSLDPSGRWVLVANYRLGEDGARPARAVVSFPVEPDGGLGPAADGVVHVGSGPDPERQEGPHPHCVLAAPDGRHVLVADLGTDRVVVHSLHPTTGRFAQVSELRMPPGCGPRHLAWVRPDLAVVTGELDNTVTSLAWDGATLRIAAAASSLPAAFRGRSHAAAVQAAPDGRFVYVSNRGDDSIAVLEVGGAGQLGWIARHATGRTPRHFALHPGGEWLLVGCQDDHEVIVLRRDPSDGRLSGPVARLAVGSPMCVRLGR